MKLHLNLLLAALFLSVCAVETADGAVQRHGRRASPFDGLRWVGAEPEVQVGEHWYVPLAIDDLAVREILEFCDRRWPGQRQKRFGEDLVEAMVLMERTPGEAVTLDLAAVADGVRVRIEGVVMTEEKRNAIRNAGASIAAVSAPRSALPPVLLRLAAEQDLTQFAAALEDQFAYLHLTGVDLAAEVAAIAEGLGEEVSVRELAHSLRRLMAKFGDGHADVSSAHDERVQRFTPFLLEEVRGGIVAVRPDRSDFVDPQRPFVRAIDGRELGEWIDAQREIVPAGSPQYVRSRALRSLREIDLARRRLGIEEREVVRLALARSPAGDDGRDVELSLGSARPVYGNWPPTDMRLLSADQAPGIPGGIGYLRLADMDDELVPGLHAFMARVRDADGLIVDVRGNGGGRRGLLLALAGYLVGPDEAPRVVNVAAYRASKQFAADHLGGSRHMYRADDPIWSEAQRAAIAKHAETFTPEWPLPAGFSDWHYLVLDRTGAPGEYHFAGPVVVLGDAGSFSATDVFLGALAELPRVELLGKASGGGSARAATFQLAHSGIQVRCASMASFRADGRLFDRRGVEVDVEVEREPADVLAGRGDAQLAAALERLRR